MTDPAQTGKDIGQIDPAKIEAHPKGQEMMTDLAIAEAQAAFARSPDGQRFVKAQKQKLYSTLQELFTLARQHDVTTVAMLGVVARLEADSKMLGQLTWNDDNVEVIKEAIFDELGSS